MLPDPTSPRRPTRVLVIDDQWLVRAALRVAIEEAEDLVVVGEAADTEQGLRLCTTRTPDVALVDLAGPGHAEVELTRLLQAHHPHVQVMVVAADLDGQRVRRALDAGAVGYLLKDTDPETLRAGVRAVARGESPLDPRAVRAMLRARHPARGGDLTLREREVLALVGRGLANKQIARELSITDSTVKAHVGSIFARIGVTDRTSAAVWAERNLPVAAPPVETVGRDGWGRRGGRSDAGAVAVQGERAAQAEGAVRSVPAPPARRADGSRHAALAAVTPRPGPSWSPSGPLRAAPA